MFCGGSFQKFSLVLGAGVKRGADQVRTPTQETHLLIIENYLTSTLLTWLPFFTR